MIITDSSFEDDIKLSNIILVDFWADWCGPCKKMSPILDEVSDEFKLPVGKLNVDENPKKSLEYAIRSIPTMVLFKDGLPVHTITGARPKHVLIKELSEWI